MPVATVYGLTATELKDDFGFVPATLSIKPGYSALDTGLLGTIYDSDYTQHGLGMQIKLDGLPGNLQQIHGVDSPELKNIGKAYSSMFQRPNELRSGYTNAMTDAVMGNALTMELEAGAVLATIAFVVSTLSGAAMHSTRRTVVVTAGLLVVLSGGYTAHRYVEWTSTNQIPAPTYGIGVLDGTPLKNAVVDNKTTAELVDGIVPLAQAQISREEQGNRDFLATADQTMGEEISSGNIALPGEGETACLMLSDVHSNADMITVYRRFVRTLNKTYGPDTLKTAFFDGDQTYGGATDKAAVDAMAGITGKNGKEYAVVGNHDSYLTVRQMRGAGMHVLDGPTVDIAPGISATGVTDPQLTKQGALFTADTVPRPGHGKETEADAGRTLLKRMEANRPTLGLAHEADALQPILQLTSISKSGMSTWFNANSWMKDPDAGDNANDGVPDIPASAAAYGHWHRQFMYRVVGNTDGTWTVVMELGTAGGVSPVQSLSHFSTPQTIPGKRASAAIMIVNDTSGLVTSVQEISTDRDGDVTAGPAHHVGSPDGQPYAVPGASPSGSPSSGVSSGASSGWPSSEPSSSEPSSPGPTP
ncbi:MAG TPA: metallophosphoesterase [Segeticoccus sp.]|uniref:metallophosphoesterase n=1 Tax=Segeticoccus sp. TaxID=2706531 RepID=UPI002D7E946C|nr:metallophosphoesterase [Segeticoccus sp.]HET8602168.1 metallophosphoesterase [Segeticoccus sp.]